jgi:ADP-heptose:LPS heptosyltransferase
LTRLLAGCRGVETILPLGAPLPQFDVCAALLSLPLIQGTTLETIPNEVPYVAADPQLIEHWRLRLAAFDEFKIGIAWQGSPRYKNDRARSIPLASFQALAEVPGVRLFSLQKGLGIEQIAAAADRVPLVDLGPELDVEAGPFMDTAAVMTNLDLVVAPDTSIAHLAGALGVPVWIALPHVAEWRWLADRDDSVWYPTARLFRQPEAGDWADPFRRMADVLRPLAVI